MGSNGIDGQNGEVGSPGDMVCYNRKPKFV